MLSESNGLGSIPRWAANFMNLTDPDTFWIKFCLLNNRISIDELVYSFSRGELDKDNFLLKYEYHRQLERRYEDCLEVGLQSLDKKEDWMVLEQYGNLCDQDYETFKLTEKYGMTPVDGYKRFLEFVGRVK